MVSRRIKAIKKIILPDKDILDAIVIKNMHRVFYLSAISIFMRIFTILTFLNKPPVADEQEALWRTGIIVSHTVYLIPVIILCGMSHKLRKNDKVNSVMFVVQYIMVITVIEMGAIITSVDQLVTYSIIPFLISCMAMGTIFIIQPLVNSLIFLSGYVTYFFGIGIVQSDLSILLSNRVNGFTSMVLGLFLSIILWRSNVINLQQEKHIQRQQSELQDKNKELQCLATTDSLTGLVNRRHFEEIIAVEMSRIKRYGTAACLLNLDMDNFKAVNDKFGHPVGDELLKGVAALLKGQQRDTDIIARMGGEEFALLLVETDEMKGRIAAERIRKSIEEKTFVIEDYKIKVTASIGMTLLNSKTVSYTEAYKYADRALYKAKAKGKNRVEISFDN